MERLVRSDGLLHLAAAGGGARAPEPALLFVHGAFAGPWVWRRRFMPFFAEHGFDSYALALDGRAASAAWTEPGLDDYVEDLIAALEGVGRDTVVVAHSLGALVAQLALGRTAMAGIALLAPVPPTGMLWSNLRLAVASPGLWLRSLLAVGDPGRAPVESTRDTMFTDATPDALVRETHAQMRAQPGRPLLEAQWPRAVASAARLAVPAFTLAAECDRLIPVDAVERTARHHGATHATVAAAGHGVMLDTPWRHAAELLLEWLGAPGSRRTEGAAP